MRAGGGSVKVEKMSPDLPAGFGKPARVGQRFDVMGSMPPIMQGEGDQGVRAQGHAETLVRMASPRFKDRALGIERQVEEVGGLCLDMLRAHCAEEFPYWIKEADLGSLKGKELDPTLYEPPAPKLAALPFIMALASHRMKLAVDCHSSSPACSHAARQLASSWRARALGRKNDPSVERARTDRRPKPARRRRRRRSPHYRPAGQDPCGGRSRPPTVPCRRNRIEQIDARPSPVLMLAVSSGVARRTENAEFFGHQSSHMPSCLVAAASKTLPTLCGVPAHPPSRTTRRLTIRAPR